MLIYDIKPNPYKVWQFENQVKWVKKLFFISMSSEDTKIIGVFNDEIVARTSRLAKWENRRIIDLKNKYK